MSKRDNNKVFNILHVVTRLPVGGVENMLLKVVTRYDKERFNATVCCIKEGGEIAEELKRLGYTVEILNRMNGHGFDIGAVADLYRLIKKENIHILRTHQYHANLYGRIAGILAGVPVIVPSFHSRYRSPKKPKLHRRIINFCLSFFSDALIAVSPSVASDILQYDRVNSSKIRVIYNGVSLIDFNPPISKAACRKELNMPENEMIIGAVGRLKEEKGHRLLIEAASELKDVYVAIAGDGPLMATLKETAEKLGVKCLFMGMIPPERIPIFLKSLDIFCFPSLWEGFPNALIEAMAAGLPVVASDIPPHREVLGEAGIYVPVGDADALAEELNTLMKDTALRENLSQKAAERAKMFSIDRTVRTYEKLFKDVLRQKGIL